VWSADITYVLIAQGFMYLVAMMDWYGRCEVAWQLSSMLDGGFCVQVLDQGAECVNNDETRKT
jgi:putative transposase